MACPQTEDGVHHLDAKLTCPCGYVMVIPPISIGIEVFNKSKELYSDHFNCDTIDGAIEGLEDAIRKLRARQ